MKKFLSFFAIALLAATAAKAQSAGAVQIGSMSVSVEVGAQPEDGVSYTTTPRKTRIVGSILIMRTSEGRTEYMLKASDIKFEDGETIDGATTDEIVTSLAKAAVAEGYRYGFTSYPTSKVWSETCIERRNMGEYTTFGPCSSNTGYCSRDFRVGESPEMNETTVTQVGVCPDCPGTSYTVVNTVE